MSISNIRSSAPLDVLASRVTGAVLTPSDPDWDIARSAWNLAADQRPQAVVVPRTSDDVVAIVRFAAEHSLRVAAQGTGHQAAALDDLADSILVHTSALSELSVDAARLHVRAGAGVIWSTISAALGEHGLAVLAGSAGDVGIVGYLTGGGYSWLSREHGLAVSTLTAVELVTGDGLFRRVDANTDAELFWALRGGGGNFGVITAVEFEAIALSDVYAGMMLWPIERAAEIMKVFADVAGSLDERATLCVRLLHLPAMPDLPEFLRGKQFAGIDGAVNAPDDAAATILAPFTALQPAIDTFARMPVAALSQIHMDPPGPVPGLGDGVILHELPAGAIDALVDAAGPDAQTPLLLVDVRMLGGALGRHDPRGGAVDHLPGQFLLNTIGLTPTATAAAAVTTATTALLESIEPWRAEYDNANFRETADAPSRFYPDDVLRRLRAVKAACDPADIIRAAHPLS